jgi:hypothetical protein
VVPHLPTTPADFEAEGLLLLSVITLSNWILATGADAPLFPYVLLCFDISIGQTGFWCFPQDSLVTWSERFLSFKVYFDPFSWSRYLKAFTIRLVVGKFEARIAVPRQTLAACFTTVTYWEKGYQNVNYIFKGESEIERRVKIHSENVKR